MKRSTVLLLAAVAAGYLILRKRGTLGAMVTPWNQIDPRATARKEAELLYPTSQGAPGTGVYRPFNQSIATQNIENKAQSLLDRGLATRDDLRNMTDEQIAQRFAEGGKPGQKGGGQLIFIGGGSSAGAATSQPVARDTGAAPKSNEPDWFAAYKQFEAGLFQGKVSQQGPYEWKTDLPHLMPSTDYLSAELQQAAVQPAPTAIYMPVIPVDQTPIYIQPQPYSGPYANAQEEDLNAVF